MTNEKAVYSLSIENLTKIFGKRLIFKNLQKEFRTPGIYGISGPNGTGKSTLVKVMAGLISPTKGKVIHKKGESVIPYEEIHNYIGFAAPYLVMYDEFSAIENINYLLKIRGRVPDKEYITSLFKQVNLFERKDDIVGTYSSGMKQRLRLIFALAHDPDVLLFDEPTSNLDEAGKEVCYEIVKNLSKDKMIILASNEQSDLVLCEDITHLETYKK
jgi:heme exporter protein A